VVVTRPVGSIRSFILPVILGIPHQCDCFGYQSVFVHGVMAASTLGDKGAPVPMPVYRTEAFTNGFTSVANAVAYPRGVELNPNVWSSQVWSDP